MNYKLSGEFDVRQILGSFKTLQQTAQTTSKNIKDSFNTVGGLILPNKMLGLADSIGAVDNKLKPVAKNLPAVSNGIQGIQGQSGTATMAVFQLSNAFQDFAVAGIRGAANNINFLLQLFPTMTKDAGGVKGAFKELLAVIKSPVGLIVGIQVLISVIDMFFGGMKKAEKQTEITTQSVDELAESFKNLSNIEIGRNIEKYNEQLDELYNQIQKRVDFAITLNKLGGKPLGFIAQFFGVSTELTQSELNQLQEVRKNLDGLKKAGNEKGYINQLNREIQDWEIRIKSIPESQKQLIPIYQQEINKRQELISQLKGEKAEKEKSLITTDAQIKKDIELVRIQLRKNNSIREEILLTQKLKELLTELSLLDPVKNISPAVDKIKQDIPKTLEGVKEISKQDAFEGANQGISALTVSTNIFQSAVQSAGQATISQFIGVVRVFNQANSVLQNFINSLAQIALQMTATGIFGGLLSIISGRTFGAGFLNILGLAEGGIVTKPTLSVIGEGKEPEAVLPLSKLNKMINNPITKPNSINVNVSGELTGSGFTLRALIKKVERLENKIN